MRYCSPGDVRAFPTLLWCSWTLSLGRGHLLVASAVKEPTFGTTVSLGQWRQLGGPNHSQKYLQEDLENRELRR